MSPSRCLLSYLAIVAGFLALVSADNTPPATLPIFPLLTEPANKRAFHSNEHQAFELAKALYNVSDLHASHVDSRFVLLSNTHRIEVDTINGGVWTADESRMWNYTLRPHLPSNEKAREIAQKLIKNHGLLPNLTGTPFKLNFDRFGATHLAVKSNQTRNNFMLDTRLIYSTTVDVPGHQGLPFFGGGGEFQFALGDGGRLIGYHGVWRQTTSRPFNATVIPKHKADAIFLSMSKGRKLVKFNSSLAYYSEPAFNKQSHLYPVYVYTSTAIIHGNEVPMRTVALPATDFGPAVHIPKPEPLTRNAAPRPTRTPGANSSFSKRQSAGFEFGTSWITDGLLYARANAQGFIDGLTAEGWGMGFNWGDDNAWESDWNANDDEYVDAVDFVFYTGHADKDGWILSPPDDGKLHVDDVAGAPDRWGGQDCEWITIAACGPLQDDLLSPGGGDVFRWGDAFDGLHILLGYAAISNDTPEEGRRLTRYARGGATLINSWFRTAQELQRSDNGESPPDGPTLWVGALWATSPGADPGNDHLWNRGSVSPDPVPATGFQAMWTVC